GQASLEGCGRVSMTRLFGWSLPVAVAMAMGTIPHAVAQVSAPPSGTQGAAAPGPGPASGEVSPTGEYQEGLPIGAWMLYPSLFVGAVWDSNNNQASSNSTAQTTTGSSPDSGVSLGVSPRLVASTSDGMHSSTLYGVGDFQFFSSNTIAAD